MLDFYSEIFPKHDERGKLTQQTTLVRIVIRNDLQHPNTYLRGATFRSLRNPTNAKLLEPLIPTLRIQNAVFTLDTTYCRHEDLIPDALE